MLYTGSEYGRVVSVSVEDLVEGERDRSTRLFEVEERSKIPEKEVTKREREINLEGKIGLVAQNRQTLFGITYISTLHPLPAFVGSFELYDLVITLPFGFGRYNIFYLPNTSRKQPRCFNKHIYERKVWG